MEIFSPLGPSMLNDPYPVYAALRDTDPVHWHEGLNAWIITRYSDCERVLDDAEVFVSDLRRIGEDVPPELLSLQTVDGADHHALRGAVTDAVRGFDLGAWLEESLRIADELAQKASGAEFDFAGDFAEPLAAASMCTLLGIPLAAEDTGFRSAQRDLMLSMDAGLAPERAEAGVRARGRLSALIERALADGTARGPLARVGSDPGDLHSRQLVNSLRSILVAGYSSVSSMLGNAVAALTADPDGPRAARRITPGLLHELIRYDGPVQAESRGVVRDVTLGGRRLRRGAEAVVVLGSANHDERAFPEPDRLRPGRRSRGHLGFGRGPHACLGSHMALRLGTAVLGRLTEGARLVRTGDPVRRPTATLRGLDRIPLRLEPAPGPDTDDRRST